MFHVQLYTRLHQARVYNLGEDELQKEFLEPMRSDRLFVYEGHEWEPRKVKLSVFETEERLRPDQIAMGRGWSNVEKLGSDVTKAAIARRPAAAAPVGSVAVALLRERLIGRLSAGPVSLQEIMVMAAELMPESDLNEQVAASHRAASELLHSGGACLAPISALS